MGMKKERIIKELEEEYDQNRNIFFVNYILMCLFVSN